LDACGVGAAKLDVGFGLDLRWGGPIGFLPDRAGRDRPSPALQQFLYGMGGRFSHGFFSWQPRDRARLRLADYEPAWAELVAGLPADLPLALHHTALNLGALGGAADRAGGELFDFTNALCERFGFRWINEDVGFWSLAGRPLPYPLPPLLDRRGLAACVKNVRRCQRELVRPLVIEFPGFAAGVSVAMGDLDAYDFFRALAEETGAPVNLDIAHLLSWRWWRGLRGEALYDDLDRLPLASCFEVHLSGCEIVGNRFIDAHHGQLLEEQLHLLGRLLPLCPRLRAVTFEDPRIEADGRLHAASGASLARLVATVNAHRAAATRLEATDRATPELRGPEPLAVAPLSEGAEPAFEIGHGDIEQALAGLLYDRDLRGRLASGLPPPGIDADGARLLRSLAAAELEEAALAVRAMVRSRDHRGTGRLEALFPRSLAPWRARRQADGDLDELFAMFLTSPAVGHWREVPGGGGGGEDGAGCCLEEAFARFLEAEGGAHPVTVEEELLSAVLRALTVAPDPAFRPPAAVRRAPGGWYAVTRTSPPVLHAALDGRYLTGPVTPLVAHLLAGADVAAAPAGAAPPGAPSAVVRSRLVAMQLLD
jgi:uncharacterized protein